MSLFGKIIARNRIRRASRELAWDPSAKNYVLLAREHVIAGNAEQVQRVCTEGLQIHPDNADLIRLGERARNIQLDQRIRGLSEDLKVSPRPAVWRELCESLLDAGRLERALETASEWAERSGDPEAVYFRARTVAEHFFRDRRAQDGQAAFELVAEAQKLMRQDPRPLELELELASRCGAWQEARKCIARLLELKPGDPALEARFRSVLSMCDNAIAIDQALVRIERSGQFVDDDPENGKATASMAVRPMLKELSSDAEVRAAVYLRGGTALVQGPRGATADRTARTIRELVLTSRASARRMSLGRPLEVRLEGDFGSLLLSPGDQSSSAIWCTGHITRKHERLVSSLSGLVGPIDGEGS